MSLPVLVMPEPTISVCLPTYNGQRFLSEAIESVLNQSVQNLELVVGDDGSTDDTRSILESYAKQDSRISLVFNEANAGYLRNTNLILRRCRGKYIKTFAQDDAFEPNCFERMQAAIESEPKVNLVCVSRRHVDEQGNEICVLHKFEQTGVFPGHEMIRLYLKEFLNKTGNPSQMFFRRTDMEGGFNTAYYHGADTEFALRLLEHGDFFNIAEPLLRYRVHKDTTTISSLADMSFAPDHVRLVDRFASYALAAGVPKEQIWACAVNGLVNKMVNAVKFRGIIYGEFPTPPLWGEKHPLDDFENDEPQVFRRLACHLIKYITDQQPEIEAARDQVADEQRLRRAVSEHNTQLLERISELEKEIQERHWENEGLRDKVQQLEQQAEGMRSSSSWKLTAPLRKLRRTISPR